MSGKRPVALTALAGLAILSFCSCSKPQLASQTMATTATPQTPMATTTTTIAEPTGWMEDDSIVITESEATTTTKTTVSTTKKTTTTSKIATTVTTKSETETTLPTTTTAPTQFPVPKEGKLYAVTDIDEEERELIKKALRHSIRNYYGEFHGVKVVSYYSAPSYPSGVWVDVGDFLYYDKVGDYVFADRTPGQEVLCAYYDDTIYYLDEAYENGILTNADLAEIYNSYYTMHPYFYPLVEKYTGEDYVQNSPGFVDSFYNP